MRNIIIAIVALVGASLSYAIAGMKTTYVYFEWDNLHLINTIQPNYDRQNFGRSEGVVICAKQYTGYKTQWSSPVTYIPGALVPSSTIFKLDSTTEK